MTNPDHHTQDLFEAIATQNHPSWNISIQALSPQAAQTFPYNIFDVTKVWPHSLVPLLPVGRLTLHTNPENYFAEVEQLAFSPAHMVPGIEPTADPMLQARLFSYSDSQRHRLGVNYQQLTVNKPLHVFTPFQRDGPAVLNNNYGALPSYPTSLNPNTYKPASALGPEGHEEWVGKATYNLQEVTEVDFEQARGLWEVLGRTKGQQDNFVSNVAGHLYGAAESVRERTYSMFGRVSEELGKRIRHATDAEVSRRG